MRAYLKSTERFQINSLMLHHKILEKLRQVKLKISWKKEIIKTGAEIDERPKKYKESMKQKIVFF
jgi:hypothetical protein